MEPRREAAIEKARRPPASAARPLQAHRKAHCKRAPIPYRRGAAAAHGVRAERGGGLFAAAADAALRHHRIELVALAGFMRLLDTGLVAAWRDRMVNIHPSLLPAFPGLHPQRQALAAGVRFSGCTVHFVRPEMDTGPIIAQAIVPVHDDDDEEGLAARILAAQHPLYPLAVPPHGPGRLPV